MLRKNQKNIFISLLFIAFLCVGFYSAKIILAQTLEVQYPVLKVSGGDLGTNPTLPKYVFYLFNIGMFAGFFSVLISLAIAGVMFLMSPAKPDFQADARDRVGGAISGLLILILTYLIITTINPQLALLNFNKLPDIPPSPAAKTPAGVYFYKGAGCPQAETSQPNTSSVPDLGDSLRDKVNSVGIVKDAENQIVYIPIIYDTVGLYGKCQYLNPNQTCQNVDNFAESASIYQYDFSPNGDGVYFYRNSYFNNKGGWFKISNSDIGKLYINNLNQLQFKDSSCTSKDTPDGCCVPKDQQDCVKYDKKGLCCTKQTCNTDGRKCPYLAGDNISSIKINGNYIVFLTYAAPGQSCNSPKWASCQAFPSSEDVNKYGPEQIKWEDIRNTGGVIPNCIIIIPVKQK